jgi:hypothetical protein
MIDGARPVEEFRALFDGALQQAGVPAPAHPAPSAGVAPQPVAPQPAASQPAGATGPAAAVKH